MTKEDILHHFQDINFYYNDCMMYDDLSRMLDELIAENKGKGEWIVQPSNKEQGERDFIWWKCSNCGQVIYSESEKDREEFHAFCGRCGKAMR